MRKQQHDLPYLCQHTVSILIVVQQHGDLGVISWAPVKDLAELPLHRLHGDFLIRRAIDLMAVELDARWWMALHWTAVWNVVRPQRRAVRVENTDIEEQTRRRVDTVTVRVGKDQNTERRSTGWVVG